MRALYYDGAGGLEWRDDPEPVIRSRTDALIRPIAVSPCDLDQRVIRGSVPLPGVDAPFAIGHEGVGEVIDVGDALTGIAPGDLVAIPYHVSCGNCDRCHAGLPLYCRATAAHGVAAYGIPFGGGYGGLFSELVRIPFANYALLPLPPNVSALHAVSAGDNLADAWRSVVPHLRRDPSADVLVMGSGAIGLYSADIARACGARLVHYVDPDEGRRRTAAEFGARTSAPEEFDPNDHEYQIALNHSGGSRRALRNAILATAPGGYVESSSFYFADIELPVPAMHMKGIHFCSALSNARAHMPEVLNLLSSGRLHPDRIITDVIAFDSADEAMPTAGFKPVFVRSSSTGIEDM
ncbi:zinc-dependent alcohol dehydrogenase [Nocardia sp. CA-129566]|uniref:zinc-dependent alcohol dehydrogenase n=1 Tax=Nocardia sp. CA-129566 TaxID=3239976 RepID=UPI003D97BCF0